MQDAQERHDAGIKSRSPRRRHRAAADRGLPQNEEELANFAGAYLRSARELWPDLATAKLLPAPGDAIIAEMVEDFKARHRGGPVDSQRLEKLHKHGLKLAAAYPRYSDDNSQPTSIVDQTREILKKAKAEGRFVPWAYVCADYAVSALTAARHGYTGIKKLIQQKRHRVDTLYIDEFSRASRDDGDWLKLAVLCKRLNIRLQGASDGFSLDDDTWRMKVHLYSIITTEETENKRRRVRRGMRGAASQNRVLGKLPLGYTRKIRPGRHADRQSDERSRHERVIDPDTAELVKQIFDLVLNQGWTPHRLAKKLNTTKVEGWNGWTADGIRKLLINPAYIGLFVWNRHRTVTDPEEQRTEKVPNPWKEWIYYYDRSLALIPKAWHVAMRKKYDKGRIARRAARNRGVQPAPADPMPTTLFSGTLTCGYCGGRIVLWKAGKWPCMYCQNGNASRHGCQLSSSKSCRIIESSLLRYLREHLLSEAAVTELFTRANDYLVQEAARPREDAGPLKSRIREIQNRIDKLVRLTEDEADEDLCRDYFGRVKQLRQQADELRADLRQKEVTNAVPPAPLRLEQVERYVADLRALLNQDIPAAAAAIRALTGPVTITQQAVPGSRRACWIAEFSPDLLRLLRQVAGRDCPDALTLEFLRRRNWTMAQSVQVRLEKVPAYERHADEVRAMLARGSSVNAIAAAFRLTWQVAKQWVDYVQTGKRPAWTAGRRTGRGGKPVKYLKIAEEVVRLRDEQQMSFARIAAQLGVNGGTVRRAYDHARPQAAQAAAAQGELPRRGRYSHLGPERQVQIASLLREGLPVAEIVSTVGVGESTVYRIRRSIEGLIAS